MTLNSQDEVNLWTAVYAAKEVRAYSSPSNAADLAVEKLRRRLGSAKPEQNVVASGWQRVIDHLPGVGKTVILWTGEDPSRFITSGAFARLAVWMDGYWRVFDEDGRAKDDTDVKPFFWRYL